MMTGSLLTSEFWPCITGGSSSQRQPDLGRQHLTLYPSASTVKTARATSILDTAMAVRVKQILYEEVYETISAYVGLCLNHSPNTAGIGLLRRTGPVPIIRVIIEALSSSEVGAS